MNQNPIMANHSMNPSMIDQHSLNNLDPMANQNHSIGAGNLGGGLIGGLNPNIQNQLPPQPAAKENKDPNINKPQPKSAADDAKQKMTSNVVDLVSNQRSQLFSTNDRYNKEEVIMQPLKSGGGPIGISRILLEEKVQLLNLNKDKTLTNDQMFEKLRIDGVYVDDPQVHQKFTDINVQKLEERILREKLFYDQMESHMDPHGPKTQYFKMNGEIKLHNDLLADEITRPADLAFETTEAYQTKEVNSILSNRLHSFKKRYYRLDIVIGKVSLLKYPLIFSQEDRLAIELREIYKEYERRTSLAMIPFYMDRLKFIEDQQYIKQRNPLTPKDELDFLQQNVEETKRKLDQEKREVQEMALKVYGKWKQIKEIRKTQGFSSTNVRMKVHKQPSIGGEHDNGEFYFNMMHEESSGKKYDGTNLPGSEVSRRSHIQSVRAYVRLIINGKYVSRTKKAYLKWPNFEIEIGEQFQVCLFTMPSSIQLEIVMGTFKETLVDVIDVEVPGKYVKALTSASSLIKEMSFSKLDFESRKLAKKFKAEFRKPIESITDEKQKLRLQEELKKKEEIEKKAIENDANGILYLKAEWKGEGPEMPPMRSENIFKQQQALKARNVYNLSDQQRMLLRQLYIDVNDPRNEAIIRFIRETKNVYLIKLLQEDAKNPLSTLKSFRHMLLDARTRDPTLFQEQIPMLEDEILQNSKLLDKLEGLYRDQAYREYLEKKIEEERQKPEVQGEQVYNKDLLSNAFKYDAECNRRRQQLYDKLQQYQKEVKAGQQKASTRYKSVIKEFELLEAENPLIALFNRMFITGRKLKPVVQKRQPVALDTCKEARVMIHIIKGFNVPIRTDVIKKIADTIDQKPQIKDGTMDQRARMSGMNQQSLYGNTGPRPQQNFLNNQGSLIPGQNQSKTGRTQYDLRDLDPDRQRVIYRTQRVQTFVEVRIVSHDGTQEVKKTNVAEGDFPEWNEILNFSLKAFNSERFTRQELANNKTMIYISLFDKEVRELDAYPDIRLRSYKRYLGSTAIPLVSLLNYPPKIEAVFKLNRPVSLIGYQVVDRFFFLKNEKELYSQDSSILSTYVQMSLSLDPVLEVPQDSEFEYYPGRETTGLLIAATEWAKAIKKNRKYEKRQIKCLGENISGQSVLLCRYIIPQAPPPDIFYAGSELKAEEDYSIEKAARYVSLIPLIDEDNLFKDFPDLYCNNQEFLDLGVGGYEEHAFLLCNFFNFIDQSKKRPHLKSYVILGIGFPEGRTAYVLRRDTLSNHVELWNPIRGEAYFYGRDQVKYMGCLSTSQSVEKDSRDPICQLKSVGCVIGQDNIWANVQVFDDPGLTEFDLENSRNWKPFFNKGNLKKYFPNERINPDQPQKLTYMDALPDERAHVIAQKIQTYLTKRFEEERIHREGIKRSTNWNSQLERTLTFHLQQIEIFRKSQRVGALTSTLSKDNGKPMRDFQVQGFTSLIEKMEEQIEFNNKKKVWGFPINVTFQSLEQLWEEVQNTKIHEIIDDEAEFSISVHVKPYSHNVLSIWFYLVALTKTS